MSSDDSATYAEQAQNMLEYLLTLPASVAQPYIDRLDQLSKIPTDRIHEAEQGLTDMAHELANAGTDVVHAVGDEAGQALHDAAEPIGAAAEYVGALALLAIVALTGAYVLL